MHGLSHRYGRIYGEESASSPESLARDRKWSHSLSNREHAPLFQLQTSSSARSISAIGPGNMTFKNPKVWNSIIENTKSLSFSKFTRLNAKLHGQHCLATCRGTNVALKVAIVCCAYYHLGGRQIFMLQKVDFVFNFCNMKICCAWRW